MTKAIVGRLEPGNPLEVGGKPGWATISMWGAYVRFFENFGPVYEYRGTPKMPKGWLNILFKIVEKKK